MSWFVLVYCFCARYFISLNNWRKLETILCRNKLFLQKLYDLITWWKLDFSFYSKISKYIFCWIEFVKVSPSKYADFQKIDWYHKLSKSKTKCIWKYIFKIVIDCQFLIFNPNLLSRTSSLKKKDTFQLVYLALPAPNSTNLNTTR